MMIFSYPGAVVPDVDLAGAALLLLLVRAVVVVVEGVVGPDALQVGQGLLGRALAAAQAEAAAQRGALALVGDAAQLPLLDVVAQDGAGLLQAVVDQAVAVLLREDFLRTVKLSFLSPRFSF